jgi:GxxExxY protein
MEHADLTERIIGAAVAVYKALGPGLLEKIYEECLAVEMAISPVRFERQKHPPITYRGIPVAASYRMDFLGEGKVVVDLKAVDLLLPVHDAQLLTYLKLTGCRVGLLISFDVAILVDGIKRLVNGFPNSVSPCLRGGA